MEEQSTISRCLKEAKDTHQLPLRGNHHMKRGWKKSYPSEQVLSGRVDLLETSPGNTDLASNLVLAASKSIFNGTELEGGRGTSLDRSGFVIPLGGGGALDTLNEFTVLLDCFVSGLRVSGVQEGESSAYIADTFSVLGLEV